MFAYTDGSCSSNPGGVGAWGYVVVVNGHPKKKEVGRDYVTTSNRMELLAIKKVLENEPEVKWILSDSQYAINCISGKWSAKANLDLIIPARSILVSRVVEFRWVRGHSGDEFNEMVDSMCEEEMREAYKEKNGVSFVSYPRYGSMDIF